MSKTIKAPAGASFRRFGVRNTASERFTVVVPTADADAILTAGSITSIPKSDGTISSAVFPVTGETITHKRDESRVLTKSGAEGVAIVLDLPVGSKRRPRPESTSSPQTAQSVAPAPAVAPDALATIAEMLGNLTSRLAALEATPVATVSVTSTTDGPLDASARPVKRAAAVLK